MEELLQQLICSLSDPIVYKVYIPRRCEGFLPSTVAHQHSTWKLMVGRRSCFGPFFRGELYEKFMLPLRAFNHVGLHPGRLTWNLQITHFERKMIFQTSMIMFHVNLQGGNFFSRCFRCLHGSVHTKAVYIHTCDPQCRKNLQIAPDLGDSSMPRSCGSNHNVAKNHEEREGFWNPIIYFWKLLGLHVATSI